MTNTLENFSNYLYRNKHILLLLFLLPPLLWLGIIYLGSLIVFLFHSLFYLDGFTGKVVYKISLSTIIELFSSPANIDILVRTVVLASVVSIGAAIIGFPIAYYMAKYTTPKLKVFFYLAIMLPLWSSYLVRVYSWETYFSKRRNHQLVFGKTTFVMVVGSYLSVTSYRGTIFIYIVSRYVFSFYLHMASIYDFANSSFFRESSEFSYQCKL